MAPSGRTYKRNDIHFEGNERFPVGSPTLNAFLLDTTSDVKLIQGPVESGKTMACIAQLYIWMCTMPRGVDGVRRSRFVVVRSTFSELRTTVVRDFLEVFPPEVYGKFKETEPYCYTMKFLDVECTVDFLSFDRLDDTTLRRLRSTQYTGAWVNEGQFVTLQLFAEIIRRTGRYPSKKMCPDYDRRKRAILDNNAPPYHEHWLLYMRGDTPIPKDMHPDQAMSYKKPDSWTFYLQPPAIQEVKDEKGELVGYELHPQAENLQNMGDDPYSESSRGGMTRDQIDRDYRNITTAEKSGSARYPIFDRDKHVAKGNIEPYEGAPLVLGIDFGTTPACVFSQKVDGRWYVLRELVAEEQLVTWEFAEMVRDVIGMHFPFADEQGIIAWGDPAGNWKGETSSTTHKTSFKIYEHFGIKVRSPWKKDQPSLRWETGRRLLSEFPNGNPRLLIDPRCRRLIASLDGGMRMKVQKIEGMERVRSDLIKNAHSHCGEAWEYGICGEGEAREMIQGPRERRNRGPIRTAGDGNVWGPPKSKPQHPVWGKSRDSVW